MPVATLDKPAEFRRLIRLAKRVAPHIVITCRDRATYNEYSRKRMAAKGAPWLKLPRDESRNGKPLSDQNPMNATGKSVRPEKETPSRDMSGREIPAHVTRGIAAGLTDKPRGK